MKLVLIGLTMSLTSMAYGQSINMEQLKERGDLIYKIDEPEPYTGEAIYYYEEGQVVQSYKRG